MPLVAFDLVRTLAWCDVNSILLADLFQLDSFLTTVWARVVTVEIYWNMLGAKEQYQAIVVMERVHEKPWNWQCASGKKHAHASVEFWGKHRQTMSSVGWSVPFLLLFSLAFPISINVFRRQHSPNMPKYTNDAQTIAKVKLCFPTGQGLGCAFAAWLKLRKQTTPSMQSWSTTTVTFGTSTAE